MAQVTATDVFDFMGTPSDIRTEHSTMINTLITQVIREVEKKIGRKVEMETFTNVLFENGRGCEIINDMMFLKGKYRDTKTITAISEDGSTLVAVADSNDSGDYYLDTRLGIIKRIDQYWSGVHNAVKISGTLGLVDDDNDTVDDLKLVITELVAVRSGLWKTSYNGEEFTNTEITKPTKKLLNYYKLRDY